MDSKPNKPLLRNPTGKAKLPDLIRTCREMANSAFGQALETALTDVERYLGAFISNSQDDDERFAYIAASDELRTKNDQVAKLFNDDLNKNFNQLLKSILRGERSATPGSEVSGGLSLLDNDQLDESLIINKIAEAIEEKLSAELYCLEQRFGHLFSNSQIDNSNNPVGPNAAGKALRNALKTLDIELKAKKIIYKLFGKHLAKKSATLYGEINAFLAKSGVLPDLKAKTPDPKPSSTNASTRTEQSDNASSQSSPANRPTDPNKENADDAFQAWFQQVSGNYDGLKTPTAGQPFQEMQQLLTAYQSNGQTSSLELTQIAVTPELVDTLSTLQQVDSYIKESGDANSQDLKRNVVNEYKQRLGDEAAHSIKQLDAETIDIVGVVFDYFLDNEELPDFVKALIGRLQIPVLKVALIDREFLSKKTHPARQLLNELTNASLGWIQENEASRDRLYERMEQIVKCILNEFTDDVAIFETQLNEFREFLGVEKKQLDAAKEALHKAAKEAERLEALKKDIAEEIANRLTTVTVPSDVEAFLTDKWLNVVIQVVIKEGDDSPMRSTALNFVSDLVWSVEPKTNRSDRSKLIGLLPAVLSTLRKGLSYVGASEQETSDVIKMLEVYHLESIRGQSEAKIETPNTKRAAEPAGGAELDEETAAVSNEITAMLAQMEQDIESFTDFDDDVVSEKAESSAADERFKQMMADMGFDMVQDDAPTIDDEYTELVRALQPGAWVEFKQEDNKRVRGKLAWEGDEYAGYSFLNRRYKVIAEKSLYGLAEEFRQGNASLIEAESLFDKAITGVTSTILGKPN